MASSPTPSRLPRGRHSLTRTEVARSQRERMLRAIADAMVERGYANTTVADVIKRAGVSRETFYQQFTSKEDCFMGAFEAAVGLLFSRGAEQPATGAPLDQLAALLDLYLGALLAEPAFARLFLVEVYAVGPDVMARRVDAQQRFVDVAAGILAARTSAERFACEALVAAISSMVTAKLAVNDLEGLRELREPLLELVRSAVAGPLWHRVVV